MNKKRFTTYLLTLLICVAAVFAYRFFAVDVQREYSTAKLTTVSKNYSEIFCDNQSKQVKAADRLGVQPVRTVKEAKALLANGKLIRIYTCHYYRCLADYPYLVPEAADLLAEIGRRYQEKLGKMSLLRVTSCFRTIESVAQLQKVNGNAVKNSCHLRGTTFDISYKYMSDRQKEALAQALCELQQAGYCYVKYEINQPCFHITANK